MRQTPNWWEIAREGKYAEMESAMLAATDRGVGYFPECEARGSYYENWGDTLDGAEQIAKYEKALNYWQMHAAQSTSGGEGTARMLDVHRLEKKLAELAGNDELEHKN